MKSYLEVLWIINALCLYVSWHLSGLLTKNRCKKKKLILCSLALSFIKSIYIELYDLLFGLLFCVFSFCISGWKFLFWLESWLFYFILIHAASFLAGIKTVHLMIVAEASSLNWIALIILFIMLDVMTEYGLLNIFEKSELMIPVTIKTAQGQVECIGYIDTGNCCTHEHKPVIFTRYPFYAETALMISAMGHTKLYPAIDAQILIGSQWQDVVAVIAKDLQVDCLLHRSMR